MNKKEFIKTLTDMSGHTLEKHDWDAGWDAAISEVLEFANELDEPEKVVIPVFMAEHIIRQKELTATLLQAIGRIKLSGTEMVNWITNDGNDVLFCKAWLDGYEVKKEKLYYAKIKGHELVETGTTIEDGRDVSEWNRNVYFVLQKDGQIIVDMKESGLSGAKHVMTMSQWNTVGINDGNADFEEVQQ